MSAMIGRTANRFPHEVAEVECGVTGWKIVRYVEREGDPPRYAAVQDGRRRAWGLRDEASASRWIARLTAPMTLSMQRDPGIADFALTHPTN